ncbi:MAG: flagellar biosynthetic protein FliO [Candidatus Thiodiazotropha taylori]
MCRWLLIGLFFSNALMAAEEGNKQIGVNVSSIGAEGLLNTFSGLLVVLAVIVGAAWLFKRYGQMSMGGKGMVKVLGGASVGSRERVVVVEVEDTRVLLGVAPGQVRMLHLLSAESPSFREHLQGLEQQEPADHPQSEPSQ